VKNESEVGKISYGIVCENLDQCICCMLIMTLTILVWHGRGMHCIECHLVFIKYHSGHGCDDSLAVVIVNINIILVFILLFA